MAAKRELIAELEQAKAQAMQAAGADAIVTYYAKQAATWLR